MSESKGSKGMSLRTNKRKGPRPSISAPKQISGPIQQTGDPRGGNSSTEAQRQQPKRPPVAGGQVRAPYSVLGTYTNQFRLLILSNGGIRHDSTTYHQTSTPVHLLFHLYLPFQANMLLKNKEEVYRLPMAPRLVLM